LPPPEQPKRFASGKEAQLPRRIQPKPAVEFASITLKLPADLVRRVDLYAKHLGGRTDRTHVIEQAIEIALESDRSFRKVQARAGAAVAAVGA
jgi:hypothetical protein